MIAQLEAVELFEQNLNAARRARLFARLRGRQSQLCSLAAAPAPRAHHTLGARTVPIEQIRGTEGRRDDFDAAFRPARLNVRQRWQTIAAAALRGEYLPPVELIYANGAYYVRDGHHRVSVAAALGQREIDATVIQW